MGEQSGSRKGAGGAEARNMLPARGQGDVDVEMGGFGGGVGGAVGGDISPFFLGDA